jgi:hypothetical protein
MSCWFDSNHKEAWNTWQQTEDKREKIQALLLAKECYFTKLDLLTNATVVDDGLYLRNPKTGRNHRSMTLNAIKKNQMSLTIMKIKNS